ncbi:MAG: helix-turn-helix transcriptional regulator [Rhodobiaceae bacterium]|nr:helix-turn-helix transcriptional regulator [Rhodobiaceae bacterium]
MDPDRTPQFLTTHEVAELLRVKERKIYDLAAENAIPCRRVTGKLLFPRDELETWLAGGGQAPAVSPRPVVLAGSHDPLLDWAVRESGSAIATLFDGSLDGVARMAAGEAIAAGLHVYAPETDSWNVPLVRERLGQAPFVLVEWCRRRRGLVVAPDAAGDIRALANLKGRRVVRRQPSAGAGLLLADLMARDGIAAEDIRFTADIARTETDAAAAVASGEADAALGLESLAERLGLAFVPIIEERFDLLVDRRSWFEPPLQTLMRFARTDAFAEKVRTMAGYDIAGLGTVHWNGP